MTNEILTPRILFFQWWTVHRMESDSPKGLNKVQPLQTAPSSRTETVVYIMSPYYSVPRESVGNHHNQMCLILAKPNENRKIVGVFNKV